MLTISTASKQISYHMRFWYSKTCVKRPLTKRPKMGFQDQLSLDAGQKYCRMRQGEHSAILQTFIKLLIVIKIFVLSILSGLIRHVLLYFPLHRTATVQESPQCSHTQSIEVKKGRLPLLQVNCKCKLNPSYARYQQTLANSNHQWQI